MGKKKQKELCKRLDSFLNDVEQGKMHLSFDDARLEVRSSVLDIIEDVIPEIVAMEDEPEKLRSFLVDMTVDGFSDEMIRERIEQEDPFVFFNGKSDIYHLKERGCLGGWYTSSMKPKRMRLSDAVSKGMRPCKNCCSSLAS